MTATAIALQFHCDRTASCNPLGGLQLHTVVRAGRCSDQEACGQGVRTGGGTPPARSRNEPGALLRTWMVADRQITVSR